MKKQLFMLHALIFAAMLSFAQTPLSQNGRLKVVGTQLQNQCGTQIQLRGMSSHAVQPHKNCLTDLSMRSLAKDWGSDLIRLAVYPEDLPPTTGYINDSVTWNNWIFNMVDIAESYGMYVIVDWHILNTGNPTNATVFEPAKKFFATMSRKLKNKRHVIYEICNEPNSGTSWTDIKRYAETIIPIIRKNDPEGLILVGTPEFSAQPEQAASNPISSALNKNVMYTFHFYAGSHMADYRTRLTNAAKTIPMFVSEWGTTTYDGKTLPSNNDNADTWTNLLNTQKISWANWSFSDVKEGSAVLTEGACASSSWTSRTPSGTYVLGKMANSFTQCATAADDDKDGVANSEDKCPGTATGKSVDATGCEITNDADKDGVIDPRDICANTPTGTTVNAHGCPIELPFISKVCNGFNNYEGYAKTDFSVDSLANMEYWDRPREKNPVYSATTSGGKLVIKVTNADQKFATMGFSFGNRITVKNGKKDTSLVPLDIRSYPVVKFNMILAPNSSYTGPNSTAAMVDFQLEDALGRSISTDAGNVLWRQKDLPLNKQITIEADFTDGANESYVKDTCAKYGLVAAPACYIRKFDFSRVTKVKLVLNAGAGDPLNKDWSIYPMFNGTWTIDDFSIGYNSATAGNCTDTRDDDKDGVIQELDRCDNTPEGTPVDAKGCPLVTTGLFDETVETNAVSVYPQPATDKLSIDQQKAQYTKAIMMDLRGTVIAEYALTGTHTEVSLANAPKGLYLIKLTGSEKSELLKVVVQ